MSYADITEAEQPLFDENGVLLERVRQRVEAEEQRYGGARGDEPSKEMHRRETRLANIRAAKVRLEKSRREADQALELQTDDERKPPGKGRPYKRDFDVTEDKAQSNFTAADSRIMKTGDGYRQCYNAQLAIDSEFQLMIDTEVTSKANNSSALQPLVGRIETTHAHQTQELLADAGSRDESRVAVIETLGIDAYISVDREGSKSQAIEVDMHPATQRMLDKLSTPESTESDTQSDCRAGQRLDQTRCGILPIQRVRSPRGSRGMGFDVTGIESTPDASTAGDDIAIHLTMKAPKSPRQKITAARNLCRWPDAAWRCVRPRSLAQHKRNTIAYALRKPSCGADSWLP